MQTYGHVPKVAMIQEWKGKVADLVQNHVKRSRPSLSDKVAKLVKEMARESNQVSGKWMVFENQTRDMEGKWSKVKLALARSTLGPVAKLSESLCAGGRVMCIYTKSFEDFTDIRRVLHSLHDVGIHPTCWKADIMTYIGLYNSKNSDKEGIVVSGFPMGWFTPKMCNMLPESKTFAAAEAVVKENSSSSSSSSLPYPSIAAEAVTTTY